VIAWILKLMVLAMVPGYVPNPRVAEAVDAVAHARPLFSGEDGVTRTAALLVAIAAREGHFDPAAKSEDAYGEASGLAQIHQSNLKRPMLRELGVTPENILDPTMNLTAAAALLEESLRVCRGRPREERLALYAGGRGHCDIPEAVGDSKNRIALADYLLRSERVFWVETNVVRRKHADP
jgi:soluble lytic murein transglycosylase-like protein